MDKSFCLNFKILIQFYLQQQIEEIENDFQQNYHPHKLLQEKRMNEYEVN